MTTPDPGKPAELPQDAVRRYDLSFDRRYAVPPAEQPPPPNLPETWRQQLVPITWDGLPLQFDERGSTEDWLTGVVENVEGWYATPRLEGNNADRALTDGAVAGPKVIGAREVSITGAAAGPRAALMGFRDQLAYRAARRVPGELVIGDPWLGTSLTAMVRADSDSFRHAFIGGPKGFRYEVALTAHDWRLYDQEWQQTVLTTETAADAGRPYERLYRNPRDAGTLDGWAYESPYPPGSAAYLRNAGNVPAPVYATYDGDLTESRLTDDATSVLLEPVAAGAQILVATETLTAEAPGGHRRAEWVQPGSRPLVIPPLSTVRWHLYAQGSGRVTLSWRSAWI